MRMISYRAVHRVTKRILTEAEKAGRLSEVCTAYHACSDAIQSNRTVFRFLTDTQIALTDRYALLARSNTVPVEVIRIFALFMESGAISQLPDMDEAIDQLVAEVGSLHRCLIKTAVTVDEELRKEIISVLERRFNGKVLAEFIEDPDVLGGIEIRCGSWSYLATLRHHLNQLRQHLAVQHTNL